MGTTMSSKELPTLQQLYSFLEHRCNALESVSPRPKPNDPKQSSDRKSSHSYLSVKTLCEVCKDSHPTSQCTTFKQLSNEERYQIVRNNKLCINCLSNNHLVKNCHSHGCNICGKWHHTMLHRNKDSVQEHTNQNQMRPQPQVNVQAH